MSTPIRYTAFTTLDCTSPFIALRGWSGDYQCAPCKEAGDDWFANHQWKLQGALLSNGPFQAISDLVPFGACFYYCVLVPWRPPAVPEAGHDSDFSAQRASYRISGACF